MICFMVGEFCTHGEEEGVDAREQAGGLMSCEDISTFTRKTHVKAMMPHCSLQLKPSL